ncbi:kinase-like protein [Apiospora saccharicola]
MEQLNKTWSRLEIKDHPGIHQCLDRGNTFFDEDVPMHARLQSNRTSYTNHNWKDIAKKLSDDLWDAIENPPGWGGDATNYVPRRKLRSIVTPERAGCIISGLGSFNSHEVEILVHAAFHGGSIGGKYRKPTVKLLAALACCGAVDKYLDLVHKGVSDICLPPVYDKPGQIKLPLRCQSKWAYRLNAPYFKSGSSGTSTQGLHHHYILNVNDVLPIVSSELHEHGTSSSRSRTVTKSSEGKGPQEGGFSRVSRVKFHPDHYNFGTQDGGKDCAFALKRLHASDQTSYSREVASLLTFIGNGNKHLVQLLVSFEIQSHGKDPPRYYLLFPWADGTLWDFWKLNDALDRRINLSQWMSDQCYRLAEALQIFHNERKKQFRIPDDEAHQEELYGRHGDVKAENILWFKRQSRLVLNDFGLARLHSKISRSMQDPIGMPRTETYRAPEFDLPDSKISRSSDIFSLGCAFLEFATWSVEGFHSADVEFVDARSEKDPHAPEVTLDTFFKIEEYSGNKIPVIKPKVRNWIQRLRNNDNCTHYIADFLDLIEQHMLDPDSKTRWESGRVVDKLWVLRKGCHTDTTYWKEPVKGQPQK